MPSTPTPVPPCRRTTCRKPRCISSVTTGYPCWYVPSPVEAAALGSAREAHSVAPEAKTRNVSPWRLSSCLRPGVVRRRWIRFRRRAGAFPPASSRPGSGDRRPARRRHSGGRRVRLRRHGLAFGRALNDHIRSRLSSFLTPYFTHKPRRALRMTRDRLWRIRETALALYRRPVPPCESELYGEAATVHDGPTSVPSDLARSSRSGATPSTGRPGPPGSPWGPGAPVLTVRPTQDETGDT